MTKEQTTRWQRNKQHDDKGTNNTMTKEHTTRWQRNKQHYDKGTNNTMTKFSKLSWTYTITVTVLDLKRQHFLCFESDNIIMDAIPDYQIMAFQFVTILLRRTKLLKSISVSCKYDVSPSIKDYKRLWWNMKMKHKVERISFWQTNIDYQDLSEKNGLVGRCSLYHICVR